MRSSSRRSNRRADFDQLEWTFDGFALDEDGEQHDESLESFVVEVSAAHPEGAQHAPASDRSVIRTNSASGTTLRIDGVEGGAPAPPRELENADAAHGDEGGSNSRHDRGAKSGREPVGSREAGPGAPIARNVAAEAFVRRPMRWRPKRRIVPAWLSSCVVHVVLLSLLTTISLATLEEVEKLEVSFSAPVVEEMEFEEVSAETVESGDEGEDDIVTENVDELVESDPGQAAFGGLSTEDALSGALGVASLEGTTGVAGGGGLLGEVGGLFGNGGHGVGKFDSGVGATPLAKFFGQEIEGQRIVFVLDNSGSMQGGRLETVIAELLRCVDSLRDDQEFYVIFHSDTVYPLFYPDSVDRYVRPTPANKRMLARWLETVELCLGDSVDEALRIAALIDPDTVFLLSDGRIQGEKKLRFLLDGPSRNFPVHTFAVGMGGSVAGRRNLADIAAANGGEFSESDIPDEMKELARDELRPYHSERPGPVWGRQVKPFRPRG